MLGSRLHLSRGTKEENGCTAHMSLPILLKETYDKTLCTQLALSLP